MEQTLAEASAPKKPVEPKPESSNPGPKDEPPWASKDTDSDAEGPDSPRDYGTKQY
jgi:hypothetical protein